jgi:hypothetical protein
VGTTALLKVVESVERAYDSVQGIFIVGKIASPVFLDQFLCAEDANLAHGQTMPKATQIVPLQFIGREYISSVSLRASSLHMKAISSSV